MASGCALGSFLGKERVAETRRLIPRHPGALTSTLEALKQHVFGAGTLARIAAVLGEGRPSGIMDKRVTLNREGLLERVVMVAHELGAPPLSSSRAPCVNAEMTNNELLGIQLAVP